MKSSKSFGIIAVAAVAVMLIASAAAVQEDAFAGKRKSTYNHYLKQMIVEMDYFH
jgi:hypothetical protein